MLFGAQSTTRSPGPTPRATVARARSSRTRSSRSAKVRTRSPSTYAGWSPNRSAAARSAAGMVRLHGYLRQPTKQLLGRVPPVDLTDSDEDQAFRAEVRGWLEEHLAGEWAALRGLGGAGRDHEAHEERLAWNRLLAEHGWTCVGWPQRVRRARAEPVPAGDLPRGVRPGGRAGPRQPPRRGAARPDPDRVRHRRAAGALPAADRRGRGAVGAGLLRARRRLRPGQRADPGPPRRATEWVSTARRCGPRNAHFSQWVFVVARTEPGSASGTTGCPSCWSRWTRTASRSARSSS